MVQAEIPSNPSNQFCRCWVHKRCSGIRGKLKEDSKIKCQTWASQQTDISVDIG